MQSQSAQPSFAPLSDEGWPTDIADMQPGFATQLNVYRAMAHNLALLRAWTGLHEHIVKKTALGPVRAEIAILRIGARFGSDYEWGHHVSRARACSIDDSRIVLIKGAPEAIELDDRIVAKAVDDLVNDHRLQPATLHALIALARREAVLDLMATVGMYTTLAYLTNTFSTPLDDDIVSEMSDRPLQASNFGE